MLDEYLNRDDVKNFIKELKSSPKCLEKSVHADSKYGMQIQNELALYLFYDIILKYKLIIDDPFLFPDFLSGVEKVFRKIDDYDDVHLGITKILIRLVETILEIKDEDSSEAKREVIKYFYQSYVVNGYVYHGFSTTYEEFIKGRNFIPEKYPNHYAKILRVKQILENYKINLIDKDFNSDSVGFTDDFVMACHYSISSPGYLYQLLVRNDKDRDLYLKQDYNALISSLKRFMSNHSISGSDQKIIIKTIEDELSFLHRVKRRASIILVKRNRVISDSVSKLRDYLDSDKDLIEIVERILVPKNNCISINQTIRYGEYQLLGLEDYYDVEDVVKEEKTYRAPSLQFANSYGVVSILLIVGSLLITFGVIVSIIMILRGM